MSEDTQTTLSAPEQELPKETESCALIKKGARFEEVRDLAIQCRTTHPTEPVEWFKELDGTYTLIRILIGNG